MIRLGRVLITPRTKALMNEALESCRIGQSVYIEQFEEELARWLGVRHVLAVANGTLADACALGALKYIDGGERDEVIVPALTFIAQINAIRYNHLRPVFVDVGEDCNINTEQVEKKITAKTLAIMPTHLLGRPANMDGLSKIARDNGVYLVEDACEALGSRYRGQQAGTIGDAGCFSFFVSHAVTTGEGGAVVTNNLEIARLVRSLRNHGRGHKAEEKFIFPHIGFSAKMNSMEAIIGLGIIPLLDSIVAQRRENCLTLNSQLNANWFHEGFGECIVPHGYPLMAPSHERRQELLRIFPERYDIEVRQIFYSIPTQCEAYRYLGHTFGNYPVAEEIGLKGFYLPCHDGVTTRELSDMAVAIQREMTV